MKKNANIENQLDILIDALRNFLRVEAVFQAEDSILLKGYIPVGAIVTSDDLVKLCRDYDFRCSAKIEDDTAILNLIPLDVGVHNKTAKPLPWTNIILFIATIITSTLAFPFFQEGVLNAKTILEGLNFSMPLVAILLVHESGHYIASRHHKVKVSLPYFIPAPNILGTFGAFIKSKSPFYNRRQLLDVGASGPLAGLAISIIAIVVGLSQSQLVRLDTQAGLMLGDSLLFKFLTLIVIGSLPKGYDLILSPMAFAGWVGLFVTMLNLIPAGQLDGGHIAYALFGGKARWISKLVILTMIPLGFIWPGWFIWAFLLAVFIPSHPPTLDDNYPLDKKRRIIGYISLIVFLLTFTPTPFTGG